jgi:hypothetical protein
VWRRLARSQVQRRGEAVADVGIGRRRLGDGEADAGARLVRMSRKELLGCLQRSRGQARWGRERGLWSSAGGARARPRTSLGERAD